MASKTAQLTHEFDTYIAERTSGFSERNWVFERVHAWLADPGAPRFLLLTGEPGSGKTAIAARLVQFSRGEAPAPAICPEFRNGFLSASHFCVARAGEWIDPSSFARSISLQLAGRFPEFAQELINVGERSVNIHVVQNVTNAGVVTGVVIDLNLTGLNPQASFNAVVAKPVAGLFQGGFDVPITILVDGLDEALAFKGDTTIIKLLASLDQLPAKVRFILTSRPESAVENEFPNVDNFYLSAEEHDDANDQDMKTFVRNKLRGTALERHSDEIAFKADRNFQYVTFLLRSLPTAGPISIDGLPNGLDALYGDWLRRLSDAAVWRNEYAPVMGPLSVAFESVTEKQLRKYSGLKESEVSYRLLNLRQFIEETAGGYHLYHQSMVDFLKLPEIKSPGRRLKNEFYLPRAEWHTNLATYYFCNGTPHWPNWDLYGFRYTAAHLAEAVREEPNGNRHALVQRLVSLVSDPDYRKRHQTELDDVPALLRDHDAAVRCAALDQDGVQNLIRATFALHTFREQQLRPNALFELASKGQIQQAIRRLEFFDVDDDWAHAAQLIILWLAAKSNPNDVRFRLAKLQYPPGPLEILLELVRGSVENWPAPPRPLLMVPAPLESDVANLVDWFGGKGSDPEMLQRLVNDSFIAASANGTGGPDYLAAHDAPLLVAFAAANPVDGDIYLRRYVAIHSGYQYVQYRNRSLWIILENVLAHPDPDWICTSLRELATTALAGSSLEFRETLPLTVLALQTASGKPGAKEALSALQTDAIEQAARVPDEPGNPVNVNMLTTWRFQSTSAMPAPGDDSWGAHRRRLAAHAQILARLQNDIPGAVDLLTGAAALKRGFAGFQAPVYLMLAEAFLICNGARLPVIDTVLDMALAAAQNVQDASFCFRMTSRCNAMRERWWSAPFDLPLAVSTLVENPHHEQFTARHCILQPFVHRDASCLPIPFSMLYAASLVSIAESYHRPLAEVRSVNTGVDAEGILAPGTWVNIPDPGFATWIAARLSAEILVDQNLGHAQREVLMKLLVPVAMPNPTVVDLVISRLLLLAPPGDAAALDSIEQIVGAPTITPIVAFEANLPA
ncbi:hypothetical protein [Tunturiibacter lichenicola]|uniref:hypothetical protein n=1 Tax=Tunturiibacter lichenicola TaxID=2051959 RepID=UPI003D9BD4B9